MDSRTFRLGQPLAASRPLAAILLASSLLFGQEASNTFRFETTTRLVIVNVVVNDRSGAPIEGLKAEDFKILEDGKTQKVAVFEYQQLDSEPLPPIEAQPGENASPRALKTDITPAPPGELRYRDRRLLVFYFDFSSMPSADQIRAQRAALQFLDEHMTQSDLVAVMTYGNDLQVIQDFTSDRKLLRDVIRSFRIGDASELAELYETGTELMEDRGEAFTADETEFNIFNTDRKLSALESGARMLASLPEKKAFVFFSSGVGKTGSENHSQLRATINAAVRANLSFYPIDARGLVAEAPGGDSRIGSTRGSSMFSGRAQAQRRTRFNDQQETLFTLAADTGGKALLDTNDLSLGIVQAQEAISSYYILGYYSTTPAMDGRFRRVKVEIPSQPRARLDYRSGYFGPKDFQHFTAADRERQLEEALLLDDPVTDLTLALEVNHFRLNPDRYFVPLAVKIPGSEIALARRGGSDAARLDFIGQVRDSRGRVLGAVRDHIKVEFSEEKSRELQNRQLQYDSGFTLPPGEYNLKLLARENETGRMGTFEMDFTVPDLGSENTTARLSSVIWASQREPLNEAVGSAERNRKLQRTHPLVHDGSKLIPSITRVFRRDQQLYVFFEMYDPGRSSDRDRMSVAASVSFFRGGRKVFESEPLHVTDGYSRDRRSVPVEFQLPLKAMEPGRYICQLNVVDELGRKFAFRRAPLVLLP